MAIVDKMTTYDLNGKKLSFANWISNLSPVETPFVSMTGKEGVVQTTFQWQTDRLPAIDLNNAQVEGSKPTIADVIKTEVKTNNTQILRKVAQVSDTANVVAAYGRGKELQYQLEKAGLEIKRDLELAFLANGAATVGNSSTARKTAGFKGLVSDSATASDQDFNSAHADPDTGAKVAFKNGNANLRLEEVFNMTYQLYLANSKANVIMFHPKHAEFFANLVEGVNGVDGRLRVFANGEDSLNFEVNTVIDPLGQKFALMPNRHMPEDYLYFFNPSDWTQMVFRAPTRTKLAKEGSFEKWMIEMEVGLRHRNPYASGVLKIGA